MFYRFLTYIGGKAWGRPYTWTLMVSVIYLFLSISCQAGAAELHREGRTLMWGDRPIQLVGYSYYGLVGDRQFEAEAFLENLAAHNINFTRFFLILPWPVEPGPNVLPFRKTGGKYDLRQFNDDFFLRLRSIVKHAESLGIICQVCLFDRCGLSVADSRAWQNNPYNADRNVNGFLKGALNGFPPFCQTVGPIAEINAAFIQRVVETIGDRSNVIYEIMNEPYPELGALPRWHAWMAREIRKCLAVRTGSKVVSSCGPYGDAEIDLFSMHMAGSDRHVSAALEQSRTLNMPVILSDDGDGPCMFRPDVTRAAAYRALQSGQHFEHLGYTLTLQREEERRMAGRLDQMPALCQLNLRALAELSTPFLPRPYVRRASLGRNQSRRNLSAMIKYSGRAPRVIGELSQDGGRSWAEVRAQITGSLAISEPLPAGGGGRSLVRMVCFDEQSRRWPGPAVLIQPANQWMAQLGDKVKEAGLIRIRPNSPDGVIHRVQRGGRACYEVDLSRHGRFVYFRLENSFPRGQEKRAATIWIEYFDHPAGAELLLEYDGTQDRYADASSVRLGGSGTWKLASFTIQDATFQGRQNDGADFRFSLRGTAAPLALGTVRVEGPANSR